MKIRSGLLNGGIVILLILLLEAGIPRWSVVVVVVLGGLLARPREHLWLPWLAVIPVLVSALVPRPLPPGREFLQIGLQQRCREIAAAVENLKGEPRILGLLAGAGEAVDPGLPFRLLNRSVAGHPSRTAYLSDDRGRIVAYGGAAHAYPPGIRAIGPRLRELRWTSMTATLVFREPLIMDGRLLGGITIAERAPRKGKNLFGIKAPRGWLLRLEENPGRSVVLSSPDFQGISLPVLAQAPENDWSFIPAWAPWLILGLIWIFPAPWAAALVLVPGLWAASGGPATAVPAAILLLAALAVTRGLGQIAGPGLRSLLIFPALIGFGGLKAWLFGGEAWLPEHLFSLGPALLWIVLSGFVISAWPSKGRRLGRKLLLAAALVLLSLVLDLVLPGVLLPSNREAEVSKLPDTVGLNLDEVLNLPSKLCDLHDLCSYLAGKWALVEQRSPALLLFFNAENQLVSRWGDLQPAGDRIRLERSWAVEGRGGRLELWRAMEPWSLLEDWATDRSLDRVREVPVWSFVLTRSGMSAASLHPESSGLPPVEAEQLYRRGGGRCWLKVEGRKMPALVLRTGSWLVAEVIHWPPLTTWIARVLIAFLWILLTIILFNPPKISFKDLGTFGGKLRLLVGAAVFIPLVLLTLVLQLRFAQQQREVDDGFAIEGFRAARYTVENLAGGTSVDNDLATWLAAGWGGEVSFFDGVSLLATSRPDLMDLGLAPEIPAVDFLPPFFLGRNEPVVGRSRGRLVVAGGLRFEGRRLLLQLSRGRISTIEGVASPVDWLLGGAGLAALLALVLVRKIEDGLGRSLQNLVGVSRRLLQGEDLGASPPPPERDLAEVVAAVEGMARKVQERETRLKDQEEMLRVLLSTLAPAVFLLDEKGELLFANPSAEDLQQRVGREELWLLLGNSDLAEDELVRARPGHDESWRVGSAVVPLPGGVEGRVVVIEDVSEILRAQRLDQLNQMARIVAHEVKNPLTPIRLWVQELEEARSDPEEDLKALVDEACPALLRQVERLRDSANAFSNLVALEHWTPEKIDVSSLIDEALGEVEILQRRGIRILRDLLREAFVDADPLWLRRALDTLILNSVTAIGEEEGEILFHSRVEKDVVIVELEDSGGGVAPENLDDLFSPRFSSTRAGTGLGLALVQQVMSRAHGMVHAENATGGLRISLCFPRSEGSQ